MDAEYIWRQLNEPSWLAAIGDRSVHTADDARRYIESRIVSQYDALGYGMYAVEVENVSQPIGMCGLVKRNYLEFPDLGFALLEEYFGRGFAFESASGVLIHAFEDLQFETVFALAMPTNISSCNLLTKLGFSIRDDALRLPDGERIALYAIDRGSKCSDKKTFS